MQSHILFPQRQQKGMPGWQLLPSDTQNSSQELSHEVEPRIMGNSFNSGTITSCANNCRWKWASGSSLSQDTLSPSIAVNKCLGKLSSNPVKSGFVIELYSVALEAEPAAAARSYDDSSEFLCRDRSSPNGWAHVVFPWHCRTSAGCWHIEHPYLSWILL